MKKLLIIPLFFFSISVFGQFTKNQLYNGINLNIRNKGASQKRLADMLDSIVVSMGSGGGSSLTLVDGNGTTVNGTGDGVDLGGTLTGNATIDGGANDLLFTNIDTLSVSTTYGDLAFEYEPIDGEPHIRMETVGKIDFSSRLFNVLSTGFYFQGGGYLDGSLQMSTMVGTGSRLSLFNASGIFTASPYSVPTSDGTSGQVLQTNGSGVVTWQTPSGGSGLTYSQVKAMKFK